MSHHIVEAQDVHYTYPDGTPALEGVTFRITHGESVGLIGANGAGKSTLLLHLTGILRPASGTINVGGQVLSKQTLPQVRRAVGMVFQNPDDQLFMPTVRDDVAFGPLNMGLSEEEAGGRVREALATVGGSDLAERPPYHLSGGEKRAAAIATVLAMQPDILAMDEPTSGLDPWARRRLMELLAGFEHTKIIASHDLDMVLALCQRVILLREGRVAADGPAAEVLQDERLLAASHLERPAGLQPCPVCGSLKAP